jgi:hypothetical protein
VENSVGSNEAAQMLGLGRLASLCTKMENPRMENEVGMTQSSSRLRMQEMGTQLGIVGQNRVEGMERTAGVGMVDYGSLRGWTIESTILSQIHI